MNLLKQIGGAVVLLGAILSEGQMAPQNPSPVVDTSRHHERLTKAELAGTRLQLSVGTLFVPQGTKVRSKMPLVVHFHGAPWLVEQSVAKANRRAAVLSIQLGSGSGVYSKAFAAPERFREVLQEAAQALSKREQVSFKPVVISSFSAGYGAVREILKNRGNWDLIDTVILEDSLHASYIGEGDTRVVDAEALQPFVEFAREAVNGHKGMLVAHSEIFPGTFASTTETSDSLVRSLGLHRKPVLRWGPLGMQQVSEVRQGRFCVKGFAGNAAPDHIDHLHAMSYWLRSVQ